MDKINLHIFGSKIFFDILKEIDFGYDINFQNKSNIKIQNNLLFSKNGGFIAGNSKSWKMLENYNRLNDFCGFHRVSFKLVFKLGIDDSL